MAEQEVCDEPDGPFTYVCNDCGKRIEADNSPGKCPECGGELENISKPSNE
ncbi:rubrerythrin-like domain-containing protein [Halomarina litorea]|uniref:rubrerythrin-like domain-containing protein n=1 Tax=Halomarina litorea TaxID=2961595 RepID=UPI0020C54E5B|nr:rubrerythrin-like domain-containing protein [Halomarina sp. BCD28]